MPYITINLADRDGDDFTQNLLQNWNYEVIGTEANNVILLGGGFDVVYGIAGNNTIAGGLDDDILYGGSGNDIIAGNDGNDILDGGSGSNILAGGRGNDIYRVSLGSNTGGTIINDGGTHLSPLEWISGSGTDTLIIYEESFPFQQVIDQPENRTEVSILKEQLRAGVVGSQRDGTTLWIDLNKDGSINESDDLQILYFYNPDGTPGPGYIENINWIDGDIIVENAIGIINSEGHENSITFNVSLINPLSQDLAINYFTVDGSALSKGENEGTITFVADVFPQTLEITIPLDETNSRQLESRDFEFLARDTAYKGWNQGDIIEGDIVGDLGYRVDRYFDDRTTGFKAVGLTAKERELNLVLHGDFNEFNNDQESSEPLINFNNSQESSELLINILQEDINNFTPLYFNSHTDSSEIIDNTINKIEQRILEPEHNWTFATGTIYDGNLAPILANRGTQDQLDIFDDLSPEGVGFVQFMTNFEEIKSWLQEVSQPEKLEENEAALFTHKPNITGHSLGGALTQWIASEYLSTTDQQFALGRLEAFNMPGISEEYANKIDPNRVDNITLNIMSGDIVSLPGEQYLPNANVNVFWYGLGWDVFNISQRSIFQTHSVPMYLEQSGEWEKPEDLISRTITSSEASDFFFTYFPDPDYFSFLAGLSMVPIIGQLSPALVYRGTTELVRSSIGELLRTDFSSIPSTIISVAWNAAKSFSSAAWETIKNSRSSRLEEILSQQEQQLLSSTYDSYEVLNMGLSSDNSQALYSVTSETSDDSDNSDSSEEYIIDNFWEAISSFPVEAWEALAVYPDEAWIAMREWGETGWTAVSEWTPEDWTTSQQLTSEHWQETEQFTEDNWENIFQPIDGTRPIPEYTSQPFTVNGEYIPLAGDFNGSGRTDILWYAPGPAADYIWYFNEDGSYSSEPFTVNGVYIPVPGDFNGSGRTDILWYAPGPAADYIWYFNEDGSYSSEPFTVNGEYIPVTGDFNGSGRTDILWYAPGPAADYIWYFNEDGSYSSEPFTVNGEYIPVTGDFNGSGRTDILWYAPGPAADYIWYFNEDGSYSSEPFTVNGVYDPITGDFNGSGRTDILWYAPGPAADYIWSFNEDGSYSSERFTVNGVYTPIEGDFNGDGIDDILWYAPGPAADYIWSFNSDGTYESTPFTVNGVYEPISGDFNGNGYTDILWYAPGPAPDYLWSFGV
ncbi:FG-GAP-like repeat-containing protein [Arthrospira platensis]|uniref:FG-GAP-like repeat-containing protein n=1 Tax=Limnospira platensis TaxID=118562 RepID=UPI0016893282|nr:FG-GAP-like repeat-containing protein [Arthrospira platensis]MBD2575226.1 VCBS repeat-containing protein [Arthrospira platensis FACHB-971]